MNLLSQPSGTFIDHKKILQEFNIREGDKIADFGCGSGYFPISLAKAVGPEGQVTAIDVLTSALELVDGRAKNDGLLNITTKRANLEILGSSGLTDDSQDIVLMINILHQTKNRAGVMAEAKRVIKIDGQIIIIDYLPNNFGLGPEAKMIISPEIIKPLAQAKNLSVIREFQTGSCHWGIIFKKLSL